MGLPALAHAFNASFPAVQWIVLAYLLSITTLIVGAGRLGDLVGRRRLLVVGIALFTGASLACALATVLWALVAARAVQGAGAAVMMALAMAMVGDTVPASKTGTAMGLLGTMSAVGTALGPSVGGVLLAAFGWRALFVLTVPLGLATLALAHWHLRPDTRPVQTAEGRFDGVGTLLLAVTVGTYALAMTVPNGRSGAHRAEWLLATLIGAMLFAHVEARTPSPLVRLATLRDWGLLASLGANTLVATVMMATLVVGPFYFAQGLSLDAVRVGLVMSAGPFVAALVGVPAGRAADRFGTRGSRLVGLIAMVSATTVFAVSSTTAGIPGYIGPMAVLTAGYALFQAANNAAVMAGADANERGALAGLLNLSRKLSWHWRQAREGSEQEPFTGSAFTLPRDNVELTRASAGYLAWFHSRLVAQIASTPVSHHACAPSSLTRRHRPSTLRRTTLAVIAPVMHCVA